MQLEELLIIHYRNYVISYDTRNRTAHWVFEHLTKDSVRRNDDVDRTKSEFQEDTSIHPFFRSQKSDYKVRNWDYFLSRMLTKITDFFHEVNLS